MSSTEILVVNSYYILVALWWTYFNLPLDQNQSPCRRNLCECDRDMAYKLLDEQYKWKKQLHDKFDFDRGNYCGRADVGGEFQFSQSFLPPVQEGKHRHQVKEINLRFSLNFIRMDSIWLSSHLYPRGVWELQTPFNVGKLRITARNLWVYWRKKDHRTPFMRFLILNH